MRTRRAISVVATAAAVLLSSGGAPASAQDGSSTGRTWEGEWELTRVDEGLATTVDTTVIQIEERADGTFLWTRATTTVHVVTGEIMTPCDYVSTEISVLEAPPVSADQRLWFRGTRTVEYVTGSECFEVGGPEPGTFDDGAGATLVGDTITTDRFWDGVGPTVLEATPSEDVGGVTERDGNLYLDAPPGGVLRISRSDLPDWAGFQIAVQGALITTAAGLDYVAAGDDTVLLDGLAVARVDDVTVQGGVVADGSSRIFVNGIPVAVLGSKTVNPMVHSDVATVGGPIVLPTAQPGDTGEIEQRGTPEQKQRLDAFLTGTRTLDVDSTAGDTRLEVDGSFVEIGDGVAIGGGDENIEIAKVADTGSIVLDRPLEFDHPAGTFITRLPAESTALIADPSVEGDGGAALPTDDDASTEDSSTVVVTIVIIAALVFIIAAGGALILRARRSRAT